jgi:hypothetical protein
MEPASINALVEKHAERIKEAARVEFDALLADAKLESKALQAKVDDTRDGRRPMHDKVFEHVCRESQFTKALYDVHATCCRFLRNERASSLSCSKQKTNHFYPFIMP